MSKQTDLREIQRLTEDAAIDARKLLIWLVVGLLVSLRTFRWERAA